jgi:hypothetical protein
MDMLSTCDRCHGFVPHMVDCCPCCEAPIAPRRGRFSRLAGMLFAAVGGSFVAVTLMACYGAPAQHRVGPQQQPCPAGTADIDSDGSCTPADCDDNNAAVHPGIDDSAGDGIDQNCDGVDGLKPAAAATDPAAPPPAEPPPPTP